MLYLITCKLKIFTFILLLFFCTLSAQRILPFDSLKVSGTDDFFADDYGNIYLYRSKDFSFTKFDSLGIQKGKLLFTQPFKIQSVQNLLNIPAFSENMQQLKFFDRNLAEIQTYRLSERFGFIKMAFAEDLQQIWLLEESTKRLIQYNFRDERILNAFPLQINYEEVVDFQVYRDQLFILFKNEFSVYDLKGNRIYNEPFLNSRRLRRENDYFYLISSNRISKYEEGKLVDVFTSSDAKIVDKNSGTYFELKEGKLYLYNLKK